MQECKCTFAQRIVGDGCEVCNPELASEIDAENKASEFCQICGAPAIEDEESAGLTCSKNEQHVASMWDYEWHDFSA